VPAEAVLAGPSFEPLCGASREIVVSHLPNQYHLVVRAGGEVATVR